MIRCLITMLLGLLSVGAMEVWGYDVIVADSVTRVALPNASVFDREGKLVGLSDQRGAVPEIGRDRYPITVRYLGFNEKVVTFGVNDTIFLSERFSELPEVVVGTSKHRVLHLLAYIREYSFLTTYSDTVFLFREKMVDFMLPDSKVKFKGWSTPRVLTSKSYYRFTNSNGLDSVSDLCQHHFSWSDWMGLPPTVALPRGIKDSMFGTDTVRGKYSPTEIWRRDRDSLRVDINVMADTLSRKWVPHLASFFHRNLDFEKIKVGFNYSNIGGDSISKFDLDSYSFSIESNGREREMFLFNKRNENFFVSTDAEIYILDKEYITVKEAKKWEQRNFDIDEIGIYEPLGAPPLAQSVLSLIERVNTLDIDKIRTDTKPDRRLMGKLDGRRNFRIGRRALLLLKQLTGITYKNAHKNTDNNWRQFRKGQLNRKGKVSN